MVWMMFLLACATNEPAVADVWASSFCACLDQTDLTKDDWDDAAIEARRRTCRQPFRADMERHRAELAGAAAQSSFDAVWEGKAGPCEVALDARAAAFERSLDP